MMRYLLFLMTAFGLFSCNYTERQAIEKDKFYDLKENVTIKKLNEGQILEAALPIAQNIYKKIADNASKSSLMNKTNEMSREGLYQLFELDSTEQELADKIVFYESKENISITKEQLIFEAYQRIQDKNLYQENLQLLPKEEKIIYNYPEFEITSSDSLDFKGMWSIILNQKEVIRSIDMKKLHKQR